MIQIPLEKTPSQSIDIVLGDQACTYNLYSRGLSMYSDLYIGDVPVWLGRMCLRGVFQKQFQYLPFKGDIICVGANPAYTKLGDECKFYYLTEEELKDVY